MNPEHNDATPPAPTPAPVHTVDVLVVAKLRAAIAQVAAEHPELDTVLVTLGWHNQFTEGLPATLWINAHGEVQQTTVVQTLTANQQLMKTVEALSKAMRDTHRHLSDTIVVSHNQLAALRGQVADQQVQQQKESHEQEAAQADQGDHPGRAAEVGSHSPE